MLFRITRSGNWAAKCALFLLGLIALGAEAVSVAGSRTLVLLDDESKASYSNFLKDLEARSYELTITDHQSKLIDLFVHGERNYDHLIVFPARTKAIAPSLTSAALLKYAAAGGNILVLLGSSSTPVPLVELASQVDVTFSPKGFAVADHFNYADENDHSKLLVPQPNFKEGVKNYFAPSSDKDARIWFKGQCMVLGNNQLVQPVLTAPRTAYSYDKQEAGEFADDEGVFAVGTQMALAAAVQTRGNARLMFIGSSEVFSDSAFAFTRKGKTVNREFAKAVAAWTFQEVGVLRVNSIEHWGQEKGPNVVNGNVYRIKHNVTYSISLSEYKYDRWVPFQVPQGDELQLEFIMLDPYYRLSLAPVSADEDSTVFSTTFLTPDQHGVFTFSVNYKRPFVTYVHEKRAVTVRHFAHNEWTRSWGISGAWVWIAGMWSVVIGWVGFVALWLWSAPVPGKKVSGKKL